MSGFSVRRAACPTRDTRSGRSNGVTPRPVISTAVRSACHRFSALKSASSPWRKPANASISSTTARSASPASPPASSATAPGLQHGTKLARRFAADHSASTPSARCDLPLPSGPHKNTHPRASRPCRRALISDLLAPAMKLSTRIRRGGTRERGNCGMLTMLSDAGERLLAPSDPTAAHTGTWLRAK